MIGSLKNKSRNTLNRIWELIKQLEMFIDGRSAEWAFIAPFCPLFNALCAGRVTTWIDDRSRDDLIRITDFACDTVSFGLLRLYNCFLTLLLQLEWESLLVRGRLYLFE